MGARALAAALLALAFAAAPAHAARPLEPFPHGQLYSDPDGSGGVRSDGFRFFVWHQDRALYRVYDEAEDRTHDVPVPDGCRLIDATVNLALFGCPAGEGVNPHVLYLRSRAFVPARRNEDLPRYFWGAVGRHWISGSRSSPTTQKPENAYLNWRTGELRLEHPDFDPRRDLDDPKLRPLVTDGSLLFDREPPFVARTLLPRSSEPRPLVLERQRHPRVRLSRCARGCARMDMSARLVTWAEGGGTAGAYDVKRRRRYLWNFANQTLPPTVVHTRGHVLLGPPPQDPRGPLVWTQLRP